MSDQVESGIRSVLKIAGAYVVAKGVADQAAVESIIGGIAALVGVILSYRHHKDAPVANQAAPASPAP